MTINVFKLEYDIADPSFDGYSLCEAPSVLGRRSLEQDLIPGYGAPPKSKYWKTVALKGAVGPIRVMGEVPSSQDYTTAGLVLPVFSPHACECLRDLLVVDGELLPLASEGRFLLNITTVLDALDQHTTVAEYWCDPPTTAVDIEKFAFREELLIDVSIFRIYELPSFVLVTDLFVERVVRSNLNAFVFKRIWPLPQEIGWRQWNRDNPDDSEENHGETEREQRRESGIPRLTSQLERVAQEEPVAEGTLDLVDQLASQARAPLRIAKSGVPASKVIERLDEYIRNIQKGHRSDFEDVDIWSDLAIPMGALWGQQLVTEWGWEWVRIRDQRDERDDAEDESPLAVFCPDRSWGVFPFHYIFGCVEYGSDVKIRLAWSCWLEHRLPSPAPGRYMNMMEHLHRFVPFGDQ